MYNIFSSKRVFIIVGGLGTIVGPIIGATTFTIIDELLRPTGYYRVIFFGIILILTVLFVPGGIASLPKLIKTKIIAFKNLHSKLKENGKDEIA